MPSVKEITDHLRKFNMTAAAAIVEDRFGEKNQVVDDRTVEERSIEDFTYKVRDAVLGALDSVAPNGNGATDSDLPNLFKTIDRHAEVLYHRSRVN